MAMGMNRLSSEVQVKYSPEAWAKPVFNAVGSLALTSCRTTFITSVRDKKVLANWVKID